MSKRIKQTVENGTVLTRTTGSPEGNMKNFDVEAFSPSFSSKKASEMVLHLGDKTVRLDGRKMKTLHEVLSRHYETFEEEN